MKKALYSLMLSDEVIREVDLIAHSRGTNRSNLINQILADYVSVMTPEKRIEDIFRAVESHIAPSRELAAFSYPNQTTLSLKSSLEYKYRPTMRYEVQLFRDGGSALGELSVIFRTQSAVLIDTLTAFFKLWAQIERQYLPARGIEPPQYALYENRFTRSISVPQNKNYDIDDIASAISDYIKLFDICMKKAVSGKTSLGELEHIYMNYLKTEAIVL